ncbi:hypothetical protein MBH78_18050 [Oceanimonas sp. NS1]|nr:hypothetical protein [Oceanimonas sp. NS1]
MTKEVKLIDSKELDFTVRGDSPGMAYVARALSPEVSPNIGVGFARWEGAEVAWTVLYDEVVFVIEGCFELTANGKKARGAPRPDAVDSGRHRIDIWRACPVWLCGAPG